MYYKNKPEAIFLAGCQGIGKSTYYNLYLKKNNYKLICLDKINKENNTNSHDFYSNSSIMSHQIDEVIYKKKSFIYETVFSTNYFFKKIINKCKANNFNVKIIFISGPNIDELINRVSSRSQNGGHYIDPIVVKKNIWRSKFTFLILKNYVDDWIWFLNINKNNYILYQKKNHLL